MTGIRDVVLSLQSPVVFSGKISEWEMLKWNDEDWCNLFGDEPVPFRCGLKKCSRTPLWDRRCETKYMTMNEFFKKAQEGSTDSWQYFDYKYLHEWLKESKAFKTLSWAKFGFPELTKDDCTLWIGSSGAHTPCHMDSYGCNLVAQIHGHKQWILFPPSESAALQMTRVPYEESSVYSALNFNAPIENLSDSLHKAHIVTLSPGDVLFVPHHWWHYVENLDTAIAINTWLPLPGDDSCRLDEALVRFFISQATTGVSSAQWSYMVNPNEDSLGSRSVSTSMNIIRACLENALDAQDLSACAERGYLNKFDKCKETLNLPKILNDSSKDHEDKISKKRKLSPEDNEYLSNCSTSDGMVKEDLMDFKLLTTCNVCELMNILDAKCKCGSKEEHAEVMKYNHIEDNTTELLPAVINAFCHPDVLKTVNSLLMEQFNRNSLK